MADIAFIVGDTVQIDGKGYGTITERVERGFGTFFMVKLSNTDFEFEIEAERLQLVNTSTSNMASVQTTAPLTANTTRFQHVDNESITEFIDQQSNRNTLSKTMCDLKLLKSFFDEPAVGETRNLHEIPVTELSPLLSRFFLSVKKANGDDYEPSSLRGMLSSFDRQLRRQHWYENMLQNQLRQNQLTGMALAWDNSSEWARSFIPDRPSEENIDCYFEIEVIQVMGGRCVRLSGRQGLAVCQSGMYLDVNSEECQDILNNREMTERQQLQFLLQQIEQMGPSQNDAGSSATQHENGLTETQQVADTEG